MCYKKHPYHSYVFLWLSSSFFNSDFNKSAHSASQERALKSHVCSLQCQDQNLSDPVIAFHLCHYFIRILKQWGIEMFTACPWFVVIDCESIQVRIGWKNLAPFFMQTMRDWNLHSSFVISFWCLQSKRWIYFTKGCTHQCTAWKR